MLSEDVAAKLCTKSSSFFVASTAPSVLKTALSYQLAKRLGRVGAEEPINQQSDTSHSGIRFEAAHVRKQPHEKLRIVAGPPGSTRTTLARTRRRSEYCSARRGSRVRESRIGALFTLPSPDLLRIGG